MTPPRWQVRWSKKSKWVRVCCTCACSQCPLTLMGHHVLGAMLRFRLSGGANGAPSVAKAPTPGYVLSYTQIVFGPKTTCKKPAGFLDLIRHSQKGNNCFFGWQKWKFIHAFFANIKYFNDIFLQNEACIFLRISNILMIFYFKVRGKWQDKCE